MSVLGIDFGNLHSVVGVTRQRGVDIIANEVSNRATPTLVGFTAKERSIGEAALTQSVMNCKNTVFNVKQLLGRKFSEPAAQAEMARVTTRFERLDNDEIGVVVQAGAEQHTFTPERLVAMFLGEMKQMSEREIKVAVRDTVISVPGYWTDRERRALLDAAEVAGLNTLRLMNETTASALSYGLFKTDLPADKPVHVVLIDFGHASYSVSVCAFTKDKLKVLASAYDPSLGGRDYDRALADHFRDEFKAKYKIDINENARARLRTEVACEKLRKVLTGNSVAVINIECLMNDIDVSSKMERKDFLELVKPLNDRLVAPIERALADAGLTADAIDSVEIVGGASRMQACCAIISETLGGKTLSRTLNSSECVARGCALQCAMLSPLVRVRDYKVEDCSVHPVRLFWHSLPGVTPGSDDGEPVEIFKRQNTMPNQKVITFNRRDPFEIVAEYTHTDPPSPVGKWQLPKIPTPTDDQPPQIKVKVRLTPNGTVSIENAQLVETVIEKVEPAPAKKDDEKKDGEKDGEKKDGEKKDGDEKKEEKDGDAAAAGADAEKKDGAAADAEKKDNDAGDKKQGESAEAQKDDMATDDKKPAAAGAAGEPVKKKIRRIELQLVAHTAGLTRAQLDKLAEEEGKMWASDKLFKETASAKNALESYVYDMRNKLCDQLAAFASEAEKSELNKKLDEHEEWLYGEGDDVAKSLYVDRLSTTRVKGDLIEDRRREYEGAPEFLNEMRRVLTALKDSVADPRYEHLSDDDKTKVVADLDAALADVTARVEAQSACADKSTPPSIRCADIASRTQQVQAAARTILNKPKPKPVEEPKADEATAKEEPPAPDAAAENDQVPPPADEMKTDEEKKNDVEMKDGDAAAAAAAAAADTEAKKDDAPAAAAAADTEAKMDVDA